MDSHSFALTLVSMYARYALVASRNYSVFSNIDFLGPEYAGFIVFDISIDIDTSWVESEWGTHRLRQRSLFDRSHRHVTSFALVYNPVRPYHNPTTSPSAVLRPPFRLYDLDDSGGGLVRDLRSGFSADAREVMSGDLSRLLGAPAIHSEAEYHIPARVG